MVLATAILLISFLSTKAIIFYQTHKNTDSQIYFYFFIFCNQSIYSFYGVKILF